MTIASAAINRVRSLLSDEVTPYRWPDTELLRHASDGQRLIVREKPSASTEITVIKTEPPDLTSLGDLLVVNDYVLQALANYICHRALLDDKDDGSVNSSKSHLDLFTAQMTTQSI